MYTNHSPRSTTQLHTLHIDWIDDSLPEGYQGDKTEEHKFVIFLSVYGRTESDVISNGCPSFLAHLTSWEFRTYQFFLPLLIRTVHQPVVPDNSPTSVQKAWRRIFYEFRFRRFERRVSSFKCINNSFRRYWKPWMNAAKRFSTTCVPCELMHYFVPKTGAFWDCNILFTGAHIRCTLPLLISSSRIRRNCCWYYYHCC